jgi:hypothetical protein
MTMDWTTLTLPFIAGVNNKSDPRALNPPELLVCKNAVFTETGGIQKRRPFTALATTILPGGGSVSDLRKLAVYNNELLLFTATGLYSWNAANSKWVSRGTHMAAKLTENPVLVNTKDQYQTDRAEISNVIIFAWVQADQVYVAAIDKNTGAVLTGPTGMGATTNRPKLVALTSAVLLFYQDSSNDLVCKSISATAPGTGIGAAATAVDTAAYDVYYDATTWTSTSAVVAYRKSGAAAYGLRTVSEALSVSAETAVAQQTDGLIALASRTTGTARLAVFRQDSTAIRGDTFNINLGAVGSDIDIDGGYTGTLHNLTAAWRSVAEEGGETRCYALWSLTEDEDANANCKIEYGYLDTNSTSPGTGATLVRDCGLACHAFDHGGKIYVWAVFAKASQGGALANIDAPLQNSYFLIRDDSLVVAKASMNVAGGFVYGTSIYGVQGHLPRIQNTASNKYSFCGTRRSRAGETNYSDRGPLDIEVEFDSNSARRCVQLGRTEYISGGQILQYDGEGLAEVGFHVFPYYFNETGAGAAGNPNGTYSGKCTWEWQNAAGERDTSTTATVYTASPTNDKLVWTTVPLYVTLKRSSRQVPAIKFWRTEVNPVLDALYRAVSDPNPAATGDNGYVANDETASTQALTDNFTDTVLRTKEPFPEAPGEVESIAPPAATIIAAGQDRIFLAGVSHDPLAIWYSKTRDVDEVASFYDGNIVRMENTGGDITAIAMLRETPIVFKENAIYALQGFGFDNLGEGSNYEARLISSDVGAQSADVVAVTPEGVMFFSNKGWYLLDAGHGLTYIGAPVEDFNSQTFVAVTVLEKEHQVRCLASSGSSLMYDYLVKQWSEWEITGKSACVWNGVYYYIPAAGTQVVGEDAAHGNVTSYSLIVETAWIKLSDLQGAYRLRYASILGEAKTSAAWRVRLRAYFNYKSTARLDKQWSVTVSNGDPLELRTHAPAGYGVCEAVKFRIEDLDTDGAVDLLTENMKLTGMSLEVGMKRGLFKRLPTAQKQ